ncbi:MAG: UbiA family prenyltransferase [Planctomycetes bacterium]|nr:UbiA family prenyltransferase [Planctomycetota bacterium]
MGPEEDKGVDSRAAGGLGFYEKILTLLDLIKFPHTIFSVPFAVMSAFLAADGMPTLKQLVLILAALVMARSCAMGFNRLADFQYDATNPRTRKWTVMQMELGRSTLWAFTLTCALLFVVFAAALNTLTLYLSPVALAVVMLYSYTKRLSSASHFILGLALALAPLGAWVAIRASFDVAPCLLAAAVLLWTAGFDVIYSCQDVEHDTRTGLHSVPRRLGIRNALRVSLTLHVLMVVVLLLLTRYADLGNIYLLGVFITAALLYYEHTLVKPDDLSKVNVAFFTVNGLISMALMAFTLIDIFIS